MTYHPLGAISPSNLREQIERIGATPLGPRSALDPIRADQVQRRVEALEQARQREPIQIPQECRRIRVPSFEMWDTIEPPTNLYPRRGVMMYSMKVSPRALDAKYPKRDPETRTIALLRLVNAIKRRIRPAISDWQHHGDNTRWINNVARPLNKAGIALTKLAKPNDDTVWRLNWNKIGPVAKQPRHITSVNSMPQELYERLIRVQRDPYTAQMLTWLRSVQPGTSGVLPDQGIIWWTVEVIDQPYRVRRGLRGGETGFGLLSGEPIPFSEANLTRWMTSRAASALREQNIASGGVVIPAWIPGAKVDNYRELPFEHTRKNWRDENIRTSYSSRENRRLLLSGYAAQNPDPERGRVTLAPIRVSTVGAGAPNRRQVPASELRKIPTLGFQVTRDPFGPWPDGRSTGRTSTVYNIGRPDGAIVVEHSLNEQSGTAHYDTATIDRFYDIASVMGDAVADLFVPFFSKALIGLKTDKQLRAEYNRWLTKIDWWVELQQLVTGAPGITANAAAVGEQAYRIMNDNPEAAMELVTGAIEAINIVVDKVQRYASTFQSEGYATANLDAPLEQAATNALAEIRVGLNNALDALNRGLRPGATDSQRLHSRCVLYKKANYEGRIWPTQFRTLIPIVENARTAASAVMQHVPRALEMYADTLRRLQFIKSQIPLPWYARRALGLPVWGWGAVGVTGFLGGAVALRRRRLKRLKKPTKNRRTSRR